MNSKNITIETLKKVRAHIAFWEHGHPVVVQDIDDLFEVTYNEEARLAWERAVERYALTSE